MMVEDSNQPDPVPDAQVVEHVECAICKGGYTCVGAVKLALGKGWVRDGTAWVCGRCMAGRR